MIHQLYYANEVRAFSEIDTGATFTFSDKEHELAEKLIEELGVDGFDATKYHRNSFSERVKAAVDQKVAGQEITIAPEAPKAQIIDLFEALKKSLADVQEKGGPLAGPKKDRARRRRSPRQKSPHQKRLSNPSGLPQRSLPRRTFRSVAGPQRTARDLMASGWRERRALIRGSRFHREIGRPGRVCEGRERIFFVLGGPKQEIISSGSEQRAFSPEKPTISIRIFKIDADVLNRCCALNSGSHDS